MRRIELSLTVPQNVSSAFALNRRVLNALSFTSLLFVSRWLFHKEQSDLRFAKFNMAIPRSEVQALWMIVAFLGNSQSLPASSTQWYRYKHIVKRLFYSDAAVLSKGALVQTDKHPLPPSKGHLAACETELRHLAVLIRAGSLDPLPDQDGILTALIQKSLTLQADSHRHDANGAVNDMLFDASREVNRKTLLRDLWELSDPAASEPALLLDVESILLATVIGTDDTSSTEAGGGILRTCADLMSAWMGRLPGDKKARWIRFQKDIDKLVASLREKADAISSSSRDASLRGNTVSSGNDDVEGAFEAAFGGTDIGANAQAGPGVSAAYYRQSASLLLIASSLRASKAMQRPQEAAPVLNVSLLQNIWHMLSNDGMRKHQIFVHSGRSINDSVAVPNNFFRSIAATKVMSILALLYLGAGSSDEDTPATAEGEKGLSFVLSCLASSLESMCHMFLKQVEQSADVALFPAAENSTGESFRPSSAMCISAIGDGFAMLSTILSRTRATLASDNSSNNSGFRQMGKACLSMIIPVVEIAFVCITQTKEVGVASDTYLRSALATLRNGIGLFHEAKKSTDNSSSSDPAAVPTRSAVAPSTSSDLGSITPNESPGDDLFGGLGDDAFLNIDLDNLTSHTTSAPSTQNEASDPTNDGDATQIDVLAKGKLWSQLFDALDTAKVC